MKAITLTDYGNDYLESVERPIPEPGPDDVVVKMRAAAINYRDIEIVNGIYHTRFPLPLVPLSDGVGEIVAVGDRVTRVDVGERVAGTFWQTWTAGDFGMARSDRELGGSIDGMLAEYACLDSEGVVPVPAHLTDEEAATLPCAAVTAWHALVTEGHLKAGDSVLVQGTGGVSLFALQFAATMGAHVIATSSRDEKLKRARALGAGDTINYVETPDWGHEVRRLTNGRGVDHIIEVGGPDSFAQSLQAIRRAGQINIIGYLGGKQGAINPLDIFARQAQVRGFPVGSRQSFEAMNQAIEDNELRPVIDTVFDWRDIGNALDYLASGRHFGKIALRF